MHLPFKAQTATDFETNYCGDTFESATVGNIVLAQGGALGFGYIQPSAAKIRHNLVHAHYGSFSIFFRLGIPSSDALTSTSYCYSYAYSQGNTNFLRIYWDYSPSSNIARANIDMFKDGGTYTASTCGAHISVTPSNTIACSKTGLRWVPVCICYDVDRSKYYTYCYNNGEIQETSAYCSYFNEVGYAGIKEIILYNSNTFTASSGSAYVPNMCLSDFRLYDDVLTASDFKDIIEEPVCKISFNSGRCMDNSIYRNHPTSYKISYSSDTPVGDYSGEFDGSTCYVANTNNFVVNNKFTWSVWVFPEALNKFILDMRKSDTGYQPMYVRANGDIQFFNSALGGLELKAGIQVNKWQHIVIVKDDLTIKCYVNGVLKDTQSFASSDCDGIVGSFYHIGQRHTSDTGTRFLGRMSDFRMYARALSEEEVLRLYKVRASITKSNHFISSKIKID